MSKTENLSETRGDSFTLTINIKDSDDVAIDITGWTFYLTIKSKLSDADVDAAIQKTVTSHTDPTGGQTLITVEPSETDDLLGIYFYDVKYKDDDGEVDTFINGVIVFLENATRAGSS